MSAWIQTYTGKKFHPLEPRPEDIDIEDIAHALSNQCRFSGHTKFHYSVAQHSVLCSRLVGEENALGTQRDYDVKLWALLHDATEAYLVDLPRPIKRGSELGAQYKVIESLIEAAIIKRFGLLPTEPPQVKEVDTKLLFTERAQLLPHLDHAGWGFDLGEVEPYKFTIPSWHPTKANDAFLVAFDKLNYR